MRYRLTIAYQAEYAGHPFMPHDAEGPFAVLCRGEWDTESEAHDWAGRVLPKGARYMVQGHSDSFATFKATFVAPLYAE